MSQASASEILIGNKAFSTYKGSFTEQYVAQQFFCSENASVEEKNLFYYINENSTMEIDFVIQKEKVYPVEVKTEENLKSKSLSTVLKNTSDLFAIRFSMANYRQQEKMVNVSLSLVWECFTSFN